MSMKIPPNPRDPGQVRAHFNGFFLLHVINSYLQSSSINIDIFMEIRSICILQIVEIMGARESNRHFIIERFL